MKTNIWKEAQVLVSNNKLGKAIDFLLEKVYNTDCQKDLYLFKARFTRLNHTETVIGNTTAEYNLLQSNFLNYASIQLTKQENSFSTINSFSFIEKRILTIERRLNDSYELKSEWEKKLSLAENPNEKRRCESAIHAIDELIKRDLTELASLRKE